MYFCTFTSQRINSSKPHLRLVNSATCRSSGVPNRHKDYVIFPCHSTLPPEDDDIPVDPQYPWLAGLFTLTPYISISMPHLLETFTWNAQRKPTFTISRFVIFLQLGRLKVWANLATFLALSFIRQPSVIIRNGWISFAQALTWWILIRNQAAKGDRTLPYLLDMQRRP